MSRSCEGEGASLPLGRLASTRHSRCVVSGNEPIIAAFFVGCSRQRNKSRLLARLKLSRRCLGSKPICSQIGPSPRSPEDDCAEMSASSGPAARRAASPYTSRQSTERLRSRASATRHGCGERPRAGYPGSFDRSASGASPRSAGALLHSEISIASNCETQLDASAPASLA